MGVLLPVRVLFEAPTLTAFAAAVEAAGAASGRLRPPPPLTPVPRDQPLPLSFAQHRLWFLQQLTGGSAAYNLPAALRLSGRLDVAALEEALTRVVRRHEVLRTSFQARNTEPIQSIHPAPDGWSLPIEDVGPLEEATLHRWIAEEALQPFDLTTTPLLRTRLLRLSPVEHVLLVTMHHIASDGWSMGVLVDELVAFYLGQSGDGVAELPPLPIQYADYAYWQRRVSSEGSMHQQIAYWKRQLAEARPAEVPTDRRRQAVPGARGASLDFTVPRGATLALNQLSRASGASLFMTLLSAFQVLLQRYSGQSDVCVGTPVANRGRRETEALIGFFVNTLVMRADLSGNPSFQDLLTANRELVLAAFANQDAPFDKVVEALGGERVSNRNPLFQAMFALQNAPAGRLEVPGLTVTEIESPATSAHFDLHLGMREREGALVGRLTYDADLFERATVAGMLATLERLLEDVAGDPARALSELGRPRHLETVAIAAEDSGEVEGVHQRFERQAGSDPGRVAVRDEHEALTYGELEARSNRLAQVILAAGLPRESRVILCLDRGVGMVVGMLATLKAGCAYVPLDPGVPPARRRAACRAVGAAQVLTQARLADSFEGPVICLDRDAASIAAAAPVRPDRPVLDGQLAYLLFTSGSSGEPKAVAITHDNLIRYLEAVVDRLELGGGWQYALVSTFAADLGNTVIFPALSGGGCLHILGEQRVLSPDGVADYFREHAIDCVKIVPSHLEALLASPRSEVVPRRLLVLGGEAASWWLVEEVHRRAPRCRVANHYGPTETTVGVLAGTVDFSEADCVPVPPLGRALSGTRIHVLDADLQAVPAGAPGELHIAGAGLGRGYLGQAGSRRSVSFPILSLRSRGGGCTAAVIW